MTRVPCIVVALWLGTSGCDQDRRNDALQRMVDQARCEPNEATPWFADRTCNRTPPQGVVPWGERAAERTEVVQIQPRPELTLELVAQGRRDFQTYCAVCHGTLARGTSQVAENMALRPAPSLHTADVATRSNEHLFDVISVGYGLMPSYDRVLTPRRRWGVVAYVRSLLLSQNVQLSALPPGLRKEAQQWLE